MEVRGQVGLPDQIPHQHHEKDGGRQGGGGRPDSLPGAIVKGEIDREQGGGEKGSVQERVADKELVHVFRQGKKEDDADPDLHHGGGGKPMQPCVQTFLRAGLALFLLKIGENRQKKTADRHGGRHKMQVAGNKDGVVQIQKGGARALKISIPGLGRQHQGHIVDKEKGDGQQKQETCAYRQPSGGGGQATCHLVKIGAVIGENEQADDGKPVTAHEDGTGIDEMAVEHLEKQKGRHPEVYGKGDDVRQFAGNIPAGRGGVGPGAHFPDQSDQSGAQHGIHEKKVGKKGQDKEKLKKTPGRRNGVGGEDKVGWVHGWSPW